MKILVTDGEQRASLAVVRSLGARGHEVHVVAHRPRSLAAASRFAAAEHVLPDPTSRSEAWVEALAATCRSLGADLILPIGEVSLSSLYAHDAPHVLPVACPSPEAYAGAVDKLGLLERAEALGVDAPRTRLAAGPAELAPAADAIGFPLVVKGRRSRVLCGGRWHATPVRVASDEAELAQVQRSWTSPGELLVQEFVPGHGEAIFLLCAQGEPLVSFAHRRLREKPPAGGVSVLRESIAPDPELLRASERLLAELHFTGVAMIEFRRAPTGRAALMEVNPRLWGSLQLAIDAGVDFPCLLVDLVAGRRPEPVTPRLGVRTRWLLGDLDHLLIVLRRRSVRTLTGRGRAAALRDFARGFIDGSRSEVWRRDDWRPFARELRAWLRGAA